MRATLNDGMPDRFLPSNDQVPLLGLSKPQRRLKRVVLPAPFGPMSAVMAPRGTSRCSTSTAVMPPNRRCTASTTRIGSTLATPGLTSPFVRPVVFGRLMLPVAGAAAGSGVSSLDKGHLPLVSEDALRAEDHEQHECDADDDVDDGRRLLVGHRQQAGIRQLRQEAREERVD